MIGGVLGTLFSRLEVKLDGTGGSDVVVGGDGESSELDELGKELGGGKDGRSESIGTEDGRMELGSRGTLIFGKGEGVPVLRVSLIGRLVEGGLSFVRLGVSDVDGGSYEVVGSGELLEGGGGSVVGGGEGEGVSVDTGGEDGGTSGIDTDTGGGISAVEGGGTGGELGGGGGSLTTVGGWES